MLMNIVRCFYSFCLSCMFYQNMMSDISFDNKLYSFVVIVSVCGLFVFID